MKKLLISAWHMNMCLLIALILLTVFCGEGLALDKGSLVNQWRDYEAGKLKAPAIVQVDYTGKEYLIWVWDGLTIQGPYSRAGYSEKEILATAQAIKDAPKAAPVDTENQEVVTLKAQVVTLTAANTKLTEEKAALIKQLEAASVEKEVLK